MSKSRMDKMTTIVTRKEWAIKIMHKHIELADKAAYKARRRIDIL